MRNRLSLGRQFWILTTVYDVFDMRIYRAIEDTPGFLLLRHLPATLRRNGNVVSSKILDYWKGKGSERYTFQLF